MSLIFLVILTLIGIYAISISTTEFDMATYNKTGKIVLNAAEAGAYYGADQVPLTMDNVTLPPLPNLSSYTVSVEATETLSLRAGYGANFFFQDFRVISQGHPPPGITAVRGIEAVVMFGPNPAGTMY
jgi:hypothetical protein